GVVRPREDVGVHQRATAPACAVDAGHPAEPADLVQALLELPKPSGLEAWLAWEGAGVPPPTTFQDEHREPGLREPRGGHGAAESAADDDRAGVHLCRTRGRLPVVIHRRPPGLPSASRPG